MFPLKLLMAGELADAPEDSSENLDRFMYRSIIGHGHLMYKPYCYNVTRYIKCEQIKPPKQKFAFRISHKGVYKCTVVETYPK